MPWFVDEPLTAMARMIAATIAVILLAVALAAYETRKSRGRL